MKHLSNSMESIMVLMPGAFIGTSYGLKTPPESPLYKDIMNHSHKHWNILYPQ